MSTPLGHALQTLDHEQLYVIVSYYLGEITESKIAIELTELRGRPITRDRVHRVRLTAIAKLRRHLERQLGVEAA